MDEAEIMREKIRVKERMLQLRQQRAQELSHPPIQYNRMDTARLQFADALGLPISDVDLSQGVPQSARFAMGTLSDNPAEVQNTLAKQYPGAPSAIVDGRVGVVTPEGFRISDPYGLDWGDVTEVGTASLPPTAGALTAFAAGSMAAPTGVGVPIAAAAAGAAGGEYIRELLQKIAGTQDETPASYGTRAAISGGVEALPVVGKGIKAGWRGAVDFMRGLRSSKSELGKLVRLADNDALEQMISELAQKESVTFPDLMVFQKSDNPVLRALARQAMQFSGESQERLVNQLNAVLKTAEEAAPGLPGARSADDIVQKKMREAYQAATGNLKPPLDPTAGGQGALGAVEEGIKKRRADMTRDYNAAESLIERWNPRYDMTRARERAIQRRSIPAMAYSPEEVAEVFTNAGPGIVPAGATVTGVPAGDTAYSRVLGYIDAAREPAQRLARINAVIGQLDPDQTYPVIKELRSRVGEFLQMPADQLAKGGIDISSARAIYGDLSDTLKDPRDVVEGVRKNIIKRTNTALDTARRYYRSFGQDPVQRAYRSKDMQNPEALFENLANDPTAWSGEFRALLDDIGDNPTARDTLRRNMEAHMLASRNPQETFNAWEKKNPQALRWLYGDARNLSEAREAARQLSWWNNSAFAKAEDEAFERVGFAMQALKEHTSVRFGSGWDATRQAKDLAARVGPDGEQALRQAAFADLIERSKTIHKKTNDYALDPEKLTAGIKELEENGAWNGILTARDRKVLETARAYAKATWKTGDSGTGLAVASQIGNIRHGKATAIASAYGSYRLALMLTDTRIPYDALFQRTSGRTPSLAHPKTKAAMTAVRQAWLAPLLTPESEEDPSQ